MTGAFGPVRKRWRIRRHSGSRPGLDESYNIQTALLRIMNDVISVSSGSGNHNRHYHARKDYGRSDIGRSRKSSHHGTDSRAEMHRLGVKTVYILGTHSSVSQAIETDLLQNYTVIRIGGTEVFDTDVKVGNEIRKTKQFDTVAITTQSNFPDALAIAPFSAKNTMPILFTEYGTLRTDTVEELQKWGIKNVIISGGTGVVSSAVETELTTMGITVKRLAGSDRYDTALEIIKHFAPQSGYQTLSIAPGENYPDALTGAVLAAKNNTLLVLVDGNGAKESVAQYLNTHGVINAYIYGGNAVVPWNITSK